MCVINNIYNQNNIMESFKTNVIIQSLTTSLMSGRPLSKLWGFPSFIISNSEMLSGLFGTDAYQAYVTFTDEEKEQARTWFETHGIQATELIDGILYEDWDGSSEITFDLNKLKEGSPEIYQTLVKKISGKAYGRYGTKMVSLIVDGFMKDPEELTKTIKQNTQVSKN